MQYFIVLCLFLTSTLYSKTYNSLDLSKEFELPLESIETLDKEEILSVSTKLQRLDIIEESSSTKEELLETKKVKKNVKKAVKGYLRYKRKNRKTVRSFKREARKLLMKKDINDEDIKNFKEKLKRKKIKLGLHLICAPRAFIEGMYLLIGGGPIHCTDRIGVDNPEMNYEGSSFILGFGVGVFAHVQHFLCLLDSNQVGLYNINIGLMAKLNVGLGFDASTMIGMNGVCVSAGVGLGAGGLVGLGGIALKKLNE